MCSKMCYRWSPATVILIHLPADAICSLVDIGLKPTKGTCMDNINPTMKNELYAEKKSCVMLFNPCPAE